MLTVGLLYIAFINAEVCSFHTESVKGFYYARVLHFVLSGIFISQWDILHLLICPCQTILASQGFLAYLAMVYDHFNGSRI